MEPEEGEEQVANPCRIVLDVPVESLGDDESSEKVRPIVTVQWLTMSQCWELYSSWCRSGLCGYDGVTLQKVLEAFQVQIRTAQKCSWPRPCSSAETRFRVQVQISPIEGMSALVPVRGPIPNFVSSVQWQRQQMLAKKQFGTKPKAVSIGKFAIEKNRS